MILNPVNAEIPKESPTDEQVHASRANLDLIADNWDSVKN
jgi:hypothetical protein